MIIRPIKTLVGAAIGVLLAALALANLFVAVRDLDLYVGRFGIASAVAYVLLPLRD